jgi:hypothetical protein
VGEGRRGREEIERERRVEGEERREREREVTTSPLTLVKQ